MYDAIFFDLDGTLIDSERVALEAGRAALATLGHHDTEDLLRAQVGRDNESSRAAILERFPDISLEALHDHWETNFSASMRASVPLKAGATDLLAMLAPRHKLGLVTSSGRASAMGKLERSGMLPSFRSGVTRDDVTLAKPDPEPYLLAASQLGVTPARCLVFEDSEAGSEAGKRAGMKVVLVPDLGPVSGRFADITATDLMSGAREAGLIA